MSGEIFSDSTMLEIFRAEVETHVEALTEGLLALERDPQDMSHLDGMMRGAHSIKGAARIVGIDPAVKVAHTLEDGFVAAQIGKLTLRPDHVDVLLRGVDFLNRIARLSKDVSIDWRQLDAEATPLAAEMTTVLNSSEPTTAAAKKVVPTSELHRDALDVPVLPSSQPTEITITLPEIFDAVAAEKSRLALIEGIDSGATRIRFDLTKVLDLDATGLAFLAAVPEQFSTEISRLELIGLGDDVRFVFQVTGIDRLYSIGGQISS